MNITLKALTAGLLASGLLLGAAAVHAAGVIINPDGTVALGINDDGSLNTSVGNVAVNSGATGLSYKFSDGSFRDATSPGCLCEGWGVSTSSSGGHSGYANVDVDGGPNNLTFGAAVMGASTAVTTTSLTSLSGLSVTHSFAPSAGAPGALFEVKVKITNTTGAAINDVKYVRVMDWDVPLTEFSEHVTIKGTATTTLLEKSHLNGFATANPLSTSCDATGCGFGGVDVDVTDAGPTDHGAYFRFNFGTLADGESYEFSIFYGATGTEKDALAALGAVGAELYSLGQSSAPSGDPALGTPATYIFAFKGVGGTPVGVPEPASLALLGLGLAGLAVSRRRKQAAA